MSNFMYVHTSFINLPKRVQHCSTSVPCTQNRIITDWRKVWSFFQRCVHTTNRNNLKKIVMRFLSWVVKRNNYVECFSTHHSRSFQSTRGPNIPAKSNTITVLVLSYKVLVRSHFWKELTTSFIKTKCSTRNCQQPLCHVAGKAKTWELVSSISALSFQSPLLLNSTGIPGDRVEEANERESCAIGVSVVDCTSRLFSLTDW